MLGSLQFGILAACIVLFVPMGMAGWHLSRNKMLFFSGALFITLAVGVHLTPYFPSVSDFVSSVSSVVVFDTRDSCISSLNDVNFEVGPAPEIPNASAGHIRSWAWVRSTKVVSCEFQKLGRSDVSDLLNGSWVVIAGDSQARLLVVSLLGLVLGSERMESVRADLFKRHSNYQIAVAESEMKLDFVWAPYVSNLTDLVAGFKRGRYCPDVLVMGSALWHMLHVTNATDYGVDLQLLRSSIVSLFELSVDGPVTGSVSIRSPHMFWLGMPVLINGMLNTEEKREKMTDSVWHAYDRELRRSQLLRQSGGGPLILLDIQSLTWNCGIWCTEDGMHYHGAVYEAAVHVMLNALLIESHQKL